MNNLINVKDQQTKSSVLRIKMSSCTSKPNWQIPSEKHRWWWWGWMRRSVWCWYNVICCVKMYPRSWGAAGRYRLARLVPASGGGGGGGGGATTASQSLPCDHNTPHSTPHIPRLNTQFIPLDTVITAISHLNTPQSSLQLPGWFF